ncbi:thiopurine S-methyltransferase [soil metagenome]
MELSYWESRWRKEKTGFHMPGGYPGLKIYWNRLSLDANPCVLVPLCGKSVDLVQLERFGTTVLGVEISEKAILDFFDEQNRLFETDSHGNFIIRKSNRIEIWQGDFFKFPANKCPQLDLIYDKAALTALPPKMHEQYVNKICELAGSSATILLHHFVYAQEQMPGPPFSITESEILRLFSNLYEIKMLEENTIPAENFPPFQRRGLKSPLQERLLCMSPHSGA